jgi:hypothetical protein
MRGGRSILRKLIRMTCWFEPLIPKLGVVNGDKEPCIQLCPWRDQPRVMAAPGHSPGCLHERLPGRAICAIRTRSGQFGPSHFLPNLQRYVECSPASMLTCLEMAAAGGAN